MSEQILELQLPPSVTSHAHLSRLIRELELVENDYEIQKARAAAKAPKAKDGKDSKSGELKPLAFSRSLTECLELNKLDGNDAMVRKHLKKAMAVMKNKAPTMHFTFAAEPDAEFLQQLTEWIRKEIHPRALISVGLQPSLVGGAYVRTPNHVHDYSLKAHLHDKRTIIVNELEGLHKEPPITVQHQPTEVKAAPVKEQAS